MNKLYFSLYLEIKEIERVDYSLLKVFFGLVILVPFLAYIFVSIIVHIDKFKVCSVLVRRRKNSELDSSRFTPSRVVPNCNKRLKKVDFSTIIEERTFKEEAPINLSSISRITPIFQGSFLTKGHHRRLSESAEESPCASTPVESRYRAERFNSTFKDSSGVDMNSSYNEINPRRRSDFSVDSVFSYETEC